MRTANPVLREETFAPQNWGGIMSELSSAKAPSATMTIRGTVAKTGVLLLMCVAAALGAAHLVANGQVAPPIFWIGGLLGGLVLGLIIAFVPKSSPVLATLYAVAEGAFLGTISLAVATKLGPQGGTIVLQAVGLTLGILASLLITYALGLIHIGSTMRKCIIIGTMGVGVLYLVSFLLSMFGFGGIGFIHSSGPIGIGFSIFVIVLASLNLVLDFQFIERGAQSGAPKYMEWYAGFGLLVTLVWLYIEVLRLLSKLNRR